MPLEHFPAVYLAGPVPDDEARALDRRFMRSKYPDVPQWTGERPQWGDTNSAYWRYEERIYQIVDSLRRYGDEFRHAVGLLSRKWYKPGQHPYLAQRLPDVVFHVVAMTDGGSFPWVLAERQGKFYYMPEELPQLLYDRGESMTVADMAGWGRLVTLFEVSRRATKRCFVIRPGLVTVRWGSIRRGAEPLYPEMWLTEAVTDSMRRDAYYCDYGTAVRFRVDSDSGTVGAWCDYPYGSPRGPVYWPMYVHLRPGAGARLYWNPWAPRDNPTPYYGLQTGSLDEPVNVAISGQGVWRDMRFPGAATVADGQYHFAVRSTSGT
jgi:hypothetical protein